MKAKQRGRDIILAIDPSNISSRRTVAERLARRQLPLWI